MTRHALLFAMLVGCPATEPEPTPTGTPTNTPTAATGTSVPDPSGTSLVLHVQSAGRIPATGAVVTVDGVEHRVEDGRVALDDLVPGTVVVHIRAEGFNDASLPVELVEGRPHVRTVALLPYGTTTEFDAAAPMQLRHETATIDLPPNAFVDASGAPVTGTLRAHVTAFDVLNSAVPFPGSMTTVDGGTTDALNSFGMVDLTVVGPSGERLQLADGAHAQLSFAIDGDRTRVGATSESIVDGTAIAAWSYDMDTGRWVEEGTGFVRFNPQTGQTEWQFAAPHLSWWNGDDRITRVDGGTCVLAGFVHEDGKPVEHPWRAVVRGQNWGGWIDVSAQVGDEQCIEAPKEGTNILYVGREQVENFFEFGGSDEEGSCADAATNGCPYSFTATAVNPSCLAGRVLVDDKPRAGVLVTGHLENRTGQVQTETNADGEYCMSIPADSLVSMRASLLDNDGRFNEGTAAVKLGDQRRTCEDVNCVRADDLNLTEEDVFCVAGVIEAQVEPFGKQVSPVGQGVPFHVFGDDFTPTRPQGGVPGPQWQSDYAASGVTGIAGGFCVDLPVDVGNFEIILDPFSTSVVNCGSELSPPICYSNSEVLSATDSASYRGRRCSVDPSRCKQVVVTYNED